MLTRRTVIKATRQLRSYGELASTSGAHDHLVDHLKGHHKTRSADVQVQGPQTAEVVRRWDVKKGAYVFVQK